MISWKFLIFSFTSVSSLTIVAAYTKCETKDDCQGDTFCAEGGIPLAGCYGGLCKCYKLDGSGQAPLASKSLEGGIPLVGCYSGLCKCYKLDGSGQAPLASKCTEKTSGSCKTDCDKKTSDVVKNTNAYRCTGSDYCFCKFKKIPGAYQQCDTTDENANDCKPTNGTAHCKDNNQQCDSIIKACSCDEGTVNVAKDNCKDDTYCSGLCAVGEKNVGKLCKTKAKYKVCVCGDSGEQESEEEK